MTRNPKPNELPADIDELPPLTRPLIIDNHLSRSAVIERIADAVGIDVDPSSGQFTHRETAKLYRAVVDGEDRKVDTIRYDQPKFDLIQKLGAMYGFKTRDDQDIFLKSQMVHLLLVLVTDDRPDPFTLPSDPDPGRSQQMTPTAAIGGD